MVHGQVHHSSPHFPDLILYPSFLSFAVIQHSDQKQLRGANVYLCYSSVGSPLLWATRAGTQVGTMEEDCFSAPHWPANTQLTFL